jgi:hypothetical protein
MMNMSEARKSLSGLYPEKYKSVKIEITEYATGQLKAECSVYVDGLNHHTGATWEAAFESLAGAERTEEEIRKLAA